MTDEPADGPAWVPCDCCDDFLCRIHGCHAHDCDCPAVEEWGDVDPYSAGGPALGAEGSD